MKLYIGQTNDIDDRLHRHNSNQNLATQNKGPWKLLFYKEFIPDQRRFNWRENLKHGRIQIR
ncbi:MAG: GIY-YIG nuclease family protein [Cyclobacteriaceae bacterium]|nr:GIY-YIG nuclease family protein [Cyclobacteriaceae bacterium]